MPGATPTLRELQRWMQTVIQNPDGITAGIESEAAQSEITVAPSDIESVIGRSASLDSINRLAVYGNAYFARLIECLSQEFPAVSHAVGSETFEAFALSYLVECPSESYTLGRLGERFPQFLRDSRPVEVPAPGWPDFLIDLATYERACAEIFDGPGPEGRDLLQPKALQGIPPAEAGNVILVPVPSVQVLEFRFPVHEYATAARHDQNPSTPEPKTTWLVMTRRDYIVRRETVSKPEFLLLQAILAGRCLGEAIATAIDKAGQDLETMTANLSIWFRNWAAAGWFESVQSASRRPNPAE